MGVPSYFSYIIKNYPQIMIRNLSNIHNFFLDCNSIIYDVVNSNHFINFFNEIDNKQNISNQHYNFFYTDANNKIDNYIINATIEKIKTLINLINPSSTIFITFDGIPPVAKLEQQRNRRFKSNYQQSIINAINNTEITKWNTSSITPGTPFMKLLDERCSKVFNNPIFFNVNNIIYSGTNIYGEGEHKIFNYLRSNKEYLCNQTNVIYGLDADLIMLSINCLPFIPNIYLYRETPEFIKSINIDLEPNENYILNIPELSHQIINTIKPNIFKDINTLNNINTLEHNYLFKYNSYLNDYIFLCFLLGNDFLPHFPALNIRTGGIDKLLTAYNETGFDGFLIENQTINWNNFYKLIEFLANNEEQFIIKEHNLRNKKECYKLIEYSNEDKIKNFNNLPKYERTIEHYINPYKKYWNKRYYKALIPNNLDKNNNKHIKSICINYLEALEWTFKYYNYGCVDWRWCYQYNYPPLLSDLLKYIPSVNSVNNDINYINYINNFNDVNKNNFEFFNVNKLSKKSLEPIDNFTQLCYVLPRQSLHLLPPNLYKALIQYKSYHYVTDCEFSWAYCSYFWECHPNLPIIDINELEQFVEKYNNL